MTDSQNPLLEPEALSEGFTLIPEGKQLMRIVNAEADQNFTNKSGVKGWRWTFDVEFPNKSGDSTARIWVDNTSSFGASMLHNILYYSGVPYEEHPTLISQTTGKPRKSFSKALLQANVDNTFTVIDSAIVDRMFEGNIRWRVSCPECNWGHFNGQKITKNQCKMGDMSQCHYKNGEKIQADSASDKIFLDVNLVTIGFAPEGSENKPIESTLVEAVQELQVAGAAIPAQPIPTQVDQSTLPPELQGGYIPTEGTVVRDGIAYNMQGGKLISQTQQVATAAPIAQPATIPPANIVVPVASTPVAAPIAPPVAQSPLPVAPIAQPLPAVPIIPQAVPAPVASTPVPILPVVPQAVPAPVGAIPAPPIAAPDVGDGDNSDLPF